MGILHILRSSARAPLVSSHQGSHQSTLRHVRLMCITVVEAGGGNRTHGLLIGSQPLYLLSYTSNIKTLG